MIHSMKLDKKPFEMIASGKKTIELRLNDEKRQLIKLGDTIIFELNESAKCSIAARVINMHHFRSFDELYRNLLLEKCGYTAESIGTASANDMDIYYTKQQQQRYGVVGIELELA